MNRVTTNKNLELKSRERYKNNIMSSWVTKISNNIIVNNRVTKILNSIFVNCNCNMIEYGRTEVDSRVYL